MRYSLDQQARKRQVPQLAGRGPLSPVPSGPALAKTATSPQTPMTQPQTTSTNALPGEFVRPVFTPQPRSIVDKLIDYVSGEGPGQKYALICVGCHCHVGLATPEEFPFIRAFCFLLIVGSLAVSD